MKASYILLYICVRTSFQLDLEQTDNRTSVTLTSTTEGAYYNKSFELDLSTVMPHVSGPNHVKTMQTVEAAKEIEITRAYLVSCVNSRYEDIQAASEVLFTSRFS